MTISQLAKELQRMLEAGEISPDAIVVTPFCSCDEDIGYKEVQFVDDAKRMFTDTKEGKRIFHFGSSNDSNAVTTVKLG